MPDYRRLYIPGSTVFLTVVTNGRHQLFADAENVQRLRTAIREVMSEWPFQVTAAVVLPDHMHFLWTLPDGDAGYSKRAGRMKAKFTSSLDAKYPPGSESRIKHRESDVWQRRFWEHTIRDDDDFKNHLDYIHFNPVKHGLTTCPHLWPHSSFKKWVELGEYEPTWGCSCDGRAVSMPNFDRIARHAGE